METRNLIKAAFALESTIQSAPQGPSVGYPRQRSADGPASFQKQAIGGKTIATVGRGLGHVWEGAKGLFGAGKKLVPEAEEAAAAAAPPRVMRRGVPLAPPRSAAGAAAGATPSLGRRAARGARGMARDIGYLGVVGAGVSGLLYGGAKGWNALTGGGDSLPEGVQRFDAPQGSPWEKLPPNVQNAINTMVSYRKLTAGLNPAALQNERNRMHAMYAKSPALLQNSIFSELDRPEVFQEYVGDQPGQVPASYFTPQMLQERGWKMGMPGSKGMPPAQQLQLMRDAIQADPRIAGNIERLALMVQPDAMVDEYEARRSDMLNQLAQSRIKQGPIGYDYQKYKYLKTVPPNWLQQNFPPKLAPQLQQELAQQIANKGNLNTFSPELRKAWENAAWRWEMANRLGYARYFQQPTGQ